MAATESKKQLGVRGEDLTCAELERQGTSRQGSAVPTEVMLAP
jgi:hypothetical protein